MADDFDLETFIKHLIETVVWCQHSLDKSDDPDVLWTLADEQVIFWRLSRERMTPFYAHILASRSAQVARLPIPEYEDLLPIIQQGRLLAFLYTCTTSDTAAAAESLGFYDRHNSPPWTTWVYEVGSRPNRVEYLIAWVPPQFVDRADAGIQFCSDESILWLTDSEDMLKIFFADDLKAAHLWI